MISGLCYQLQYIQIEAACIATGLSSYASQTLFTVRSDGEN